MPFRLLLLTNGSRIKRLFGAAVAAAACEMTQCGDIESGLRSVRDERFDVIFVDAELGGLSRSLFTKQVRKSRLNSQTQLFLLSGYVGVAKSAGPAGSGMSLLAKPASDADLARILQKLQRKLVAERRRSGRMPFRAEVNCSKGLRHFQGFSVDLNAEGMLIEVAAPLARGDDLELLFCLSPGEREIRTRGRVVRRSDSSRLAIVFEKMENFDRQRIRQFLELHMPSGAAASETAARR